MGKQTSHRHPNFKLYQFQQISLLILIVLVIFAALMLIVVAVLLPAPLFVVISILLLLLASPLLMAMVNSPPILIADDGLTLQPLIGGERFIAWNEIEHVAAYPLLPQANQEILKQYLIGRKKYRAAEGIMLIVPSLPLPYRIAGFLAAEQGRPVIAFTNRSHRDYAILTKRIFHHAADVLAANLLEDEVVE